MDNLSQRAAQSTLELARTLGLRCDDNPEVLRDAANLLLHLRPAPVVARVSTTTALVRRPPELWLARDLAMAQFLVAQGFPAVPASGELPPGPHLHGGFAISFWQYVEHDRGYVANAEETGQLLRDLHQVLCGYPGELDRLSPFYELPGWLEDAERMGALPSDDVAMLRRAHSEVAAQIEQCMLPDQPLHGDAHRKNLLKTSRGLLWTDFEDCCRGPVLWDLACSAQAAAEGPEAAIASYALAGESALLDPVVPGPSLIDPSLIDPSLLEPFWAARELQAVIWMPILATRFADRRSRAAELLAAARARYGLL